MSPFRQEATAARLDRCRASYCALLSDEVNVRRLRPLLALRHLELDLRPFGQRLEAAPGDLRVMDEQILAAIIWRDEAVALVVAEPLDGSGCHEKRLLLL